MATIFSFSMAQTPEVNIVTKKIRHFCYNIVTKNTYQKKNIYIVTKMVEQNEIELTIIP
jgi:hypothetical protein